MSAAFITLIIGAAVGLAAGLRLGRAWGFRQLGAYEQADRLQRAKSRGWKLF